MMIVRTTPSWGRAKRIPKSYATYYGSVPARSVEEGHADQLWDVRKTDIFAVPRFRNGRVGLTGLGEAAKTVTVHGQEIISLRPPDRIPGGTETELTQGPLAIGILGTVALLYFVLGR